MEHRFKNRKDAFGMTNPRPFNMWIEAGYVDYLKRFAIDNDTTVAEIIRTLVRDFVSQTQTTKENQGNV